jgi:hypothetical protein
MSGTRDYFFSSLCRTYGLAVPLVLALLSIGLVSSGAALAGTWSRTGDLVTPRDSHKATRLNNGHVLVAGGFNRTPESSSYLASSELYNPVSGSWSNTVGPLNIPRAGHTATLLNSGKVLVVGGQNGSTYLSSCELYDPSDKFWEYTLGFLSTPRTGHTATLLDTGLATDRVLVVGGRRTNSVYHDTAAIYYPGTQTWGGAALPAAARTGHTATLLADGNVMVAGGINGSGYVPGAELYDPVFNWWTPAGSLGAGRQAHTATRLANGQVLVAGGENYDTGGALDTALLYDPAFKTWTPTGRLNKARHSHTATLLPNGQVLVAGGYSNEFSNGTASVELYNPTTGTWSTTGSLKDGRYYHTATLLSGSRVVVAGGWYGVSLERAEIYRPSTISAILSLLLLE